MRGRAATPARADDRYDIFNFNKLFSSSNAGYSSGYVGSTSPIGRQMASIDPKYAPGTIVISTSERRLYYVTSRGQAIRYGIGVGRQGFQWSGVKTVSAKKEWPSWTPGATARKMVPSLPGVVPGGPNSPLGARGIYLYDENGRDTEYRIHGTNEPEMIGQPVSLGCIRMYNIDAIDLYNRVKVGSKVVVR